MRATVMYEAGDVRIETVPDARLIEPTDALVRVMRAAICGSDLWPYKTMEHSEAGLHMGHEAIGVVEAVGAEVRIVKAGDLVIMPFAYSDGTCVFCHEGLNTSCIQGGFFGATDIVRERGEEAIERVHTLTNGFGVNSVHECVGVEQAMFTALRIARPGGAVGRVGVPQYETMPTSQPAFYNNLTVSGGPAPARAYMEELLPDVLEGRIEPGRVFDWVGGLDEVPDGYRAMNERKAIKVLIEF
jgi:threonine dehydrogenase-like Zn-dependent dehydrogenase